MPNFSFQAVKRSKKVKSKKTADGLHENVCKMTGRFNGKNGTETLLFDVTAVLSIAAFLRQRVVRREVFGSKYKPYFTWEMADEFASCPDGIIRFFFVVFLSNCGLAMFHSEVANRAASFLKHFDEASKRVPTNSLSYGFVRSYLRKVLCTKARMLRGRKPVGLFDRG